jgi:general L-amino acid transport system permease protein
MAVCNTPCPGSDLQAGHPMMKRPSGYARRGQWLLLLAVLAVAWLLAASARHNLALSGVAFGFGFLKDQAGFDIPFRLISWSTSNSNGRALLVCVLNTLLVSVLGMITASVIGIAVGVMRLSVNWLVRNIALAFIELIRNTPVLIQIAFWYVAVLQALPAARQSLHLPLAVLLNIRGLYIPRPILTPAGSFLFAVATALIIITPFVWRRELAGRRIGPKAALLPIAAYLCAYFGIAKFDYPSLQGFNVSGGITLPPELVALWVGLSIYSSAFIAEIVRSAIEAVPKGQNEAAQSLGLKPQQTLLLVILPQAVRMMVPPLTSQYLNLIKNSSLGAAIAYPEVFQIFTGPILSQSGREIEAMMLVLAVFLSINLLASTLMNWYNRRAAVVTR